VSGFRAATIYDQGVERLADLVRDPDDACHVWVRRVPSPLRWLLGAPTREDAKTLCGIPRTELADRHPPAGGYRGAATCGGCGGPVCADCRSRWWARLGRTVP
jgi:hypothetical protein